MKSLKVLIPAFNEIKSLKVLIPQLQKKNIDYLIINDGSNDGTENFLKKNINANNFITNKKNIGYERSIFKGYQLAINEKYEFIATFDSDLQHNIKDLITLLNFVKDYDFVIGTRDKKNLFIESIINKYFYKKYFILDALSGLKIYNIKKIKFKYPKNVNKAGMFFVIMALKSNARIKNHPIKINKRKYGNSKFGQFFFRNINLLYCFLNTIMLLRHEK